MCLTRVIASLFSLILLFSSCTLTENIRTFKIEILKPAILTIPEDADTIALIRRDFYQSDTCYFDYSGKFSKTKRTEIKHAYLGSLCIKALEDKLKTEHYFKHVINLRDSVNYLFETDRVINNTAKVFEEIDSDIYILLDYFHLYNSMLSETKDYFSTDAQLLWTIMIKNDTLSYIYNQEDQLVFDETLNPQFRVRSLQNQLIYDAAHYLGDNFGTKIIPSWLTAERQYYKSGNPAMLKAEKLARDNNWLQAAEIWNASTNNKNQRIAAKASYNMALACEMEGKIDLAIDWLVKSYSIMKTNNDDHKAFCQKYINVLANRKREIGKLESQVRNTVNP